MEKTTMETKKNISEDTPLSSVNEKEAEEILLKDTEKSQPAQNMGDETTFEISDSDVAGTSDEASEGKEQNADDNEKIDPEQEKASQDKIKIEELSERLETASDKYLRLMAEFDNFKKRTAKEYERLIETANERLMSNLVEVRENFERAFKTNDAGEKFLEGIKLIFSKFDDILKKHGLEIYSEVGQEFDPELHDALMRMPNEKIPEGHIIEVHERGYKLKGKTIKHSRVIVSSGIPVKEPEETKNAQASVKDEN